MPPENISQHPAKPDFWREPLKPTAIPLIVLCDCGDCGSLQGKMISERLFVDRATCEEKSLGGQKYNHVEVFGPQSELISPVTAVRAAHGKIARHLHTAARPPGHERESTELLIRTLPAHPAGPPHPRTQSLICC
ncbi:unnamed protein product [Pleuronectes platessa]|uniref:Uncharacterized protein n=1 Tax=Pleuronectes platessa TaxID=8262 RepID=A0A9N7Z0H0_PLEPL|nr:unnamed protein product [Pleuronectes platessa]